MKIKKIAGTTLAIAALTLALASCKGKENKTTNTDTTPTTTEVTPTTGTTPVTTGTDPVTTTGVTPTTDTGVTPTTTEITTMESTIAESAMTYAEYEAAELGDEVVIDAYIQGKQSWWSNKGTFYLQDDNGGYFVYELGCTEADYNDKLTIGSRVKIKGVKGAWSGQVEILGSEAGDEAIWQTVKAEPKIYVAQIIDFTKEAMTAHANQLVQFVGLEVVEVTTPQSDGGDIYYKVKKGDLTLTFCVESYLCNKDTAVYQKVLSLKAGDEINVVGFMYTYNDPQLHTTSCQDTPQVS